MPNMNSEAAERAVSGKSGEAYQVAMHELQEIIRTKGAGSAEAVQARTDLLRGTYRGVEQTLQVEEKEVTITSKEDVLSKAEEVTDTLLGRVASLSAENVELTAEIDRLRAHDTEPKPEDEITPEIESEEPPKFTNTFDEFGRPRLGPDFWAEFHKRMGR